MKPEPPAPPRHLSAVPGRTEAGDGHGDAPAAGPPELQVRVFYMAEDGTGPHTAVVSCSEEVSQSLARAPRLRAAVDAFFAVMGGEVLSVQVELSTAQRLDHPG